MKTELEHHRVAVNGIHLHVVTAGPKDGTPIILLHGFPDFWYSWRHQIDPLVEVGFRLIIPDQRGYNLSDKPSGLKNYRIDRLAADVLSLADHFGLRRVHLVGHDWGGAVAWWTAHHHPERVNRLITLNIPHPVTFRRGLLNFAQLRRSYYMFLFQVPWLPEWFLQRGRYQLILDSLQDDISKDAFTASDVETYREAFEQPGAIRAMLNWYRAAFRCLPPRLAHPKVLAQTLILWGRNDPHLGIELGRQSVHQCTRAYFEEFSDAGHFVHQDAAWQVNQSIYQFLREE